MIDLLDPELHARGEATAALDALRTVAPVAWRDGRRGPGYWAITGYPELVAAACDARTFSSWWGTRPEVRRAPGAARPLHNLDPPEHTALRRVAAGLVAPARLPDPGPIVDDVLAPVIASRGGDAVRDLAMPIVARAFAAWLGLPAERAPELAARVDAVHTAGAAHLDALGAAHRDALGAAAHREVARDATAALAAMLRDALAAADRGALAVLREAGLDRETATHLAVLLVEAGLPTTIDAIASAFALVHRAPPSIPLAVEEVLRLAPPIQQFARHATCNVELGGATIRAGQQVVLWYGAANRDPRRGQHPHVAFGVGPHRCLGATFARQLVRATLAAWFARVPEHGAAGERRASSYLGGYRTLAITR